MKLARTAITIAATALIAASGTYGLAYAGIDVGQAITESRCRAGAFMYHNAKTTVISDESSQATPAPPAASPASQVRTAIGPNLIPNSNLESLAARIPANWQSNHDGQNQASFSLVPGHASVRAVRTDVTGYTDGNANWHYDEVAVTPGGYYQYSDYYRSDTTTRAILMLKDTAGRVQYINLRNAGPAANWTLYRDTFFIPENVTQAMVFHPLAARGFLEADDFSLIPVRSQGFTQPAISITFDDGWRGIHDTALPLMQRYGIVSTQYLVSGYIGQAKNYVTAKQAYELRDAGHEIASHSVSHLDLPKQNAKIVTHELSRSKQDLDKCYGLTSGYAAPYGTYNQATLDEIRKYYKTARSTDAGINTSDNFDPYRLLVQNVNSQTTPEQISSWIETARKNNGWLILVYHDVIATPDTYGRRPADFERDLQIIKASGLRTKTVEQAYQELVTQ